MNLTCFILAASSSFRDRSSVNSAHPTIQTLQDASERQSLKKRFSLSALQAAFAPAHTMVRHRTKSRPSARSLSKPFDEPLTAFQMGFAPLFQEVSNSNSNSNTTSSGPSTGPMGDTNTTAKTSLDSKLSKSSTQTNSGHKELKPTPSVIRRAKEPELDSRDSPLEPIVETAFDHWAPTIKTVEKAAAAKIYLETYYNDLLSKASPRSMRLQYLEAQLYHSRSTIQEKCARRKIFYQKESEHLRETRVLNSRSFGPTLMGLPGKLADRYDILKILGKGSFGVVRLVREKVSEDPNSSIVRRPVYAMKVIRKSAMLRTSQEGHLRAERDFLVSSDGSNW